jgi:TusA-related sulfurtransferase
MSDEILIDARWLEPPEPMEKALQALAGMQPGQQVRMLLHREPYPLYAILENRGYRHDAVMQADGSYEILIRPAASLQDTP